jgi:hypothetical protein
MKNLNQRKPQWKTSPIHYTSRKIILEIEQKIKEILHSDYNKGKKINKHDHNL